MPKTPPIGKLEETGSTPAVSAVVTPPISCVVLPRHIGESKGAQDEKLGTVDTLTLQKLY